ncbi:MAG: type II toxin-antitoxin system VapC family toxin [Chloroflexi bacterium]|nr:type II toxin-antitoxin system VapC family toxin [Chloroflexota bacterium]
MSTSWICVDANIVVPLVVGSANVDRIIALWTAWHKGNHPLVAPTLLPYEVSNALRRYVAHGDLLPHEAAEALDAALHLGIILEGDTDLHKHALSLAEQFSLPAAYDAHYLVVASRRQAEFWTADRRLAKKVQSELPWVHLVEG